MKPILISTILTVPMLYFGIEGLTALFIASPNARLAAYVIYISASIAFFTLFAFWLQQYSNKPHPDQDLIDRYNHQDGTFDPPTEY